MVYIVWPHNVVLTGEYSSNSHIMCGTVLTTRMCNNYVYQSCCWMSMVTRRAKLIHYKKNVILTMTYTSQFSSQAIQACIPTGGCCWCAKLQWSKPNKQDHVLLISLVSVSPPPLQLYDPGVCMSGVNTQAVLGGKCESSVL